MALSRHSANSVFNLEEIGEKNFFFQIGHINQWLFCLIHFSKSSMQKWKIHFFVVLIIPLYNNSFLNELFKWITTSDVQFDFLHVTYLKPVLIVKYSLYQASHIHSWGEKTCSQLTRVCQIGTNDIFMLKPSISSW